MSGSLAASDPAANYTSARGEPTWEVVRFYPRQGEWTDTDFLALSVDQFVELNDGCLEVLPMPTVLHQAIVELLVSLLKEFVTARNLGKVLFAPLPVKLWEGQYREPDIVFLGPERLEKLRAIGFAGQPEGADLVMEVVSPGDVNRRRDLVDKRDVYARAGIPEYWIVDPEQRTITVLALEGTAYRTHGEFTTGDIATSVLLHGFTVRTSVVFAIE